MASVFSQVNLSEDEELGDWQYIPKNLNKRKRHATSTSSVPTGEDFEIADNKTKLSMIFEEIMNSKVDHASTRELIMITNKYMKIACEKTNGISSVVNQQSTLLKTLAYKSIDIEARSRRNNLLFRGIKETRFENCTYAVMDFLANILQIDTTGVVITRAHRLGAIKVGQTYNRPIIVNFMNYNHVELIMSNARTLQNCPGYSIDRDMPKEINDARKRMWSQYKDTKIEHPQSKVKIVYPAKLMCGKRVIRDEFPDWHSVLNQSRIVSFPVLDTFATSETTVENDIQKPGSVISGPTSGIPHPSSNVTSDAQGNGDDTDTVIDLSQPRDRLCVNEPTSFKTQESRDTSHSNNKQNNTSQSKTVNSNSQPETKEHHGSPRMARPATRRQSGQRRAKSVSLQRGHNDRSQQIPHNINKNSSISSDAATPAVVDSG